MTLVLDKELVSLDTIYDKIDNDDYCRSNDWITFKIDNDNELTVSYTIEFNGKVIYEKGDYYLPSSSELIIDNVNIDILSITIDNTDGIVEDILLESCSDEYIHDIKRKIVNLYNI
jgi:hypothetical protein